MMELRKDLPWRWVFHPLKQVSDVSTLDMLIHYCHKGTELQIPIHPPLSKGERGGFRFLIRSCPVFRIAHISINVILKI